VSYGRQTLTDVSKTLSGTRQRDSLTPPSQRLLSGKLSETLEGLLLADSVEKLEIPATTNFALM
jgi:hypothetical protein